MMRSSRLAAVGVLLAGLVLASPAGATEATSQPTSRQATSAPVAADEGDSDGSGLQFRDDDGPGLFRERGASGGLGWQMVAAIVVVLVLGAAALVVSKKLLPKLQDRPGRRIAVLETAYLGPRKSLQLVRVGGKQFLLASTKEHVRLLAEVTGSFDEAYASALSQQGADDSEELSV